MIPKAELLAAYNRASEKAGRPILTARAFGQTLRKLRPGLQDAQRTGKAEAVGVLAALHSGGVHESADGEMSQQRCPVTAIVNQHCIVHLDFTRQLATTNPKAIIISDARTALIPFPHHDEPFRSNGNTE